MKFYKKENALPLEELKTGKIELNVNGEDVENIWVRSNEEGHFLQNHALNMYPYPSWGIFIPKELNGDISSLRGNSPDDSNFYLHPEAYDHLKEFIDENDNFDYQAYFIKQIKEKEKTQTD